MAERQRALWYVGIDWHWQQTTICILNEKGQRVQLRTIRKSWFSVLEWLKEELQHPFAVCFEASNGYGVLGDRLAQMAERVVVAHPGQLRLIFRSKRKNDRVDAEKLAKLLFLDAVPAVWVPPAEVRAWRSLIEYRQRVLAERTRVKNRIRALLRGQGLAAAKGLWTRAGQAWLAGQRLACTWDELRRDDLQQQLQALTERLKRLTSELDRRARSQAATQLLMTIPGVGPRTAEAVAAYLDEVKRFARGKQVASYFGLVPCQDSSGGVNRLGRITRQGPPTVRRLLVEAAWQGIRRSPQLKSYFDRLVREDRDRRKIALVATAHHLARVMFAMLRTGETWREAA
jgi:transposase